MEHERSLDRARPPSSPEIGRPRSTDARIATARQRPPSRRLAGTAPPRRVPMPPSAHASASSPRSVSSEPGIRTCVSGIAEPAVVLEDPRPVLGQHQPRVEHAGVADPLRRHRRDRRSEDLARSIRSASASSTNGTGEYAPMPPVFGPVSPSPTRLKSCANASGTGVAAVGQGERRHLAARRGTPRSARSPRRRRTRGPRAPPRAPRRRPRDPQRSRRPCPPRGRRP